MRIDFIPTQFLHCKTANLCFVHAVGECMQWGNNVILNLLLVSLFTVVGHIHTKMACLSM